MVTGQVDQQTTAGKFKKSWEWMYSTKEDCQTKHKPSYLSRGLMLAPDCDPLRHFLGFFYRIKVKWQGVGVQNGDIIFHLPPTRLASVSYFLLVAENFCIAWGHPVLPLWNCNGWVVIALTAGGTVPGGLGGVWMGGVRGGCVRGTGAAGGVNR